MKKLIVLAALLFSSPAFAQTASTVAKPKVYRAFVYETNCILEYGIQTYDDICKVIETRETGGALRTRNIFSNKFPYWTSGIIKDSSSPVVTVTAMTGRLGVAVSGPAIGSRKAPTSSVPISDIRLFSATECSTALRISTL